MLKGLKRLVKNGIVNKLPKRLQRCIERTYLYYCVEADYVRNEAKIIKLLCNTEKTSLDIGANQGVLTLFICKYSSYVYCFEPIPWLSNHLKNKFNNCNVSVENFALGEKADEMYLNIPFIAGERLESRASLVSNFEEENGVREKISKLERVKVKVKRLDDFSIVDIGFIKIDVEGFELEVLRGGIETIKRYKPRMLIEIEQRYHKKHNVDDIFNYITGMGYYGYFFCDGSFERIEDFDVNKMQNPKNEKTKRYINNFIFLNAPISKRAWKQLRQGRV